MNGEVKAKRTRRQQADVREDAALYGAYMAMTTATVYGEPKEVCDLRVRILSRLKGRLYEKQLTLYAQTGEASISQEFVTP